MYNISIVANFDKPWTSSVVVSQRDVQNFDLI